MAAFKSSFARWFPGYTSGQIYPLASNTPASPNHRHAVNSMYDGFVLLEVQKAEQLTVRRIQYDSLGRTTFLKYISCRPY